ncbi:MAG TPA: hypothetical protein VEQ83_00065 [Lapillicoccus sp.]|nr:hypothetical protein [Lapillicoccus sp.]
MRISHLAESAALRCRVDRNPAWLDWQSSVSAARIPSAEVLDCQSSPTADGAAPQLGYGAVG